MRPAFWTRLSKELYGWRIIVSVSANAKAAGTLPMLCRFVVAAFTLSFGVASGAADSQCRALHGSYSGVVTQGQTVTGSTSELHLTIASDAITASLTGADNPHIEIVARSVTCRWNQVSGQFVDNFGTEGTLVVRRQGKRGRIGFNVTTIGNVINDAGFYPETPVMITKY